MSIKPNKSIDYTNKDYDSFKNLMLSNLAIQMPEYTDLSESDAGIVILELLAKGLDILSFYQDVLANEVLLSTAEQRGNVLKWCKILGYTPRNSTPSKIKQVFVLNGFYADPTIIPAGTKVKTITTGEEEPVYFETVEDLIIPANQLGNETDLSGNYLYSVTAIQGMTIMNEELGTSNGLPDQKFSLKYQPVLDESVVIRVDEGSGLTTWDRVDSFLDSDMSSAHYKIEISDDDEATIIFGNGINGRIPVIYENGITATYRIGGGVLGNVGANTVTSLDSTVARVESTFNPDVPFESGIDKETIDDIKVNAPNSYRTKWACITAKDYADRLKEVFPQVVFASAEQCPDEGKCFQVDVYAMLQNNETLTDELKAEIMEMFNNRKMIGTSVNLIGTSDGTFVSVDFDITLLIGDDYSSSEIKANIESILTNYFSIGNYDFNTPCSVTDLEAMLQKDVEGITSIRIASSSNISESTDLIIKPSVSQILTLGDITFTVIGEENEG